MFSDFNPLDRETAILEIVIMLLGAFLIGFLAAFLAKKNKNSASKPENFEKTAWKEAEKEMRGQLKKNGAEMKRLQSQLEEATGEKKKLLARIKKLEQRQPVAASKNQSSPEDKAKLKQMQSDLAKAKSRITGLSAKLKSMEPKLAGLGPNLSKDKSTTDQSQAMARLKTKVKDLEKSLLAAQRSSAPAGADDLKRQNTRLKASVATTEAVMNRSKRELKEAQATIQTLEKQQRNGMELQEQQQTRIDELQRQMESFRVNSSKGEAERNTTAARKQPKRESISHAAPRSKAIGKLTGIRGLNVGSSEQLEKMGITTLERLAKLDDNTVEHIARSLDRKPSQVRNWMSQAEKMIS